MSDLRSNPWMPAPASAEEAGPLAAPVQSSALVIGATAPQPSVPAPDAVLAIWRPGRTATLWVVGAHGGAGESTLASLFGGVATDHRWPSLPVGSSAPVLLAARTHPAGIAAARRAMQSWAAGATPPVRLLGLVLIADAPGKLPKPWREDIHVLAGGVPRLWQLGWSEQLRAGDLDAEPRDVRALRLDVAGALLTDH